jgi:mannosyltransferase
LIASLSEAFTPTSSHYMKKLSQERTTIVLFIVFLLIAALLRLYKLDKDGLWYDELHSIIPTHPNAPLRDVIEYSKLDQPPLFFVMLHGWFKIFPYDEISGKMLCVLLGLLGTCAMFFLGNEIGGRKVGLASMFITALSNFHIYHSQELRFYTLLFLLTSLSIWVFIRFLKFPTVVNACLFIVLSVALLYTHYFALVVVLTEAIIFIVFAIAEKCSLRFWLKGVIIAFVTLILFSPWLPAIFGDLGRTSFWIPEIQVSFFAETFTKYFQGWLPLSFKWVLNVLLLAMMGFFVLWFFSPNRTRSEKRDGLTLIAWLVLTLAIPYVYSLARMPMLVDRYTMITFPVVIVIIAVGWTSIKPVPAKIIIAVIFVICVGRVTNRYYKKPLKPQYREIAQQVISHNKNKLPVFSDHSWHLNYYAKKYASGYDIKTLVRPIGKSVDSLLGFYVIFEAHLSDSDKAQISKNFIVKEKFNLFQADAVYYERRAGFQEKTFRSSHH